MASSVEHLGLFAPLPAELARQFPPLSQDSSPAHVTILYLGETSEEDIPKVQEVLQQELATFTGPVTATLERLDYFRNPAEKASVAHVTVAFSKDVESLRRKCLAALEAAGLHYPQKYPWYNPHVTLKYQEGLWDVWEGPVPSGQWTFDTIGLWASKPLASLGLAKAASKFKSKKTVKTQKGDTAVVYEYSEKQVQHRNREKANRVEKLRGLRGGLVKKVRKDYGSAEPKTRLSALAVGLIDLTYERVGNAGSAREGHFGVTGWQVRHFSFSGSKATISYVGKSGVKQQKTVKDAKAVALLKSLAKGKKPGDNILAEEGFKLTPSDVNAYLPEGITAKDLRGLHANEEMRNALKRHRKGSLPSDLKEREKKLKAEFKAALEEVASLVGHEASTLRSQYLVPGLEDTFVQKGKVMPKLNKQARLSIPGVRVAMVEIPGLNIRPSATSAFWYETEDDRVAWDPSKSDDSFFEHLRKKDYLARYRHFGVTDTLYNSDNELVMTSDSGVYVPFMDAMIRSGEWDSREAALVLSSACERCMNVIGHYYGSKDGYAFGSEEYWRCGTSCDFCKHVPAVRSATKTRSEREDEGASSMLKKEPKKKPPRRDLRRNRAYDSDVDDDKDFKDQGAEGDKDLSLNYKRVASDKARTEDAAKKQFEQYQEENPDTKKTWEDFFEKGEKKGPAQEGQTPPGQSPSEGQPAPAPKKKPKPKPKPPGKSEIGKSLKGLSKDLGMDLDAEIQTALRGALGNLSPLAGKKLIKEIKSEFGRLQAESPPLSREAVDEAREELNSLSEALEGSTSPAAVIEQVSNALQAQKVLEDFSALDDPKKNKERIQKSVQKAFGVDSVSPSVEKKLSQVAEGMDLDDRKEFFAELKQAQAEIEDALAQNNEGDTHFPPGFLEKATKALQSDSFGEKDSTKDKARNIALSIAAESAMADPFNLGGTPISADSKSDEELAARGLQSFEKYKDLSPGMRKEAAEKITKRLEEVNEDSPEAAELNRVLDGIALASVANMGPDGEVPKVPGREMTPAFAKMAQKIAERGDASVLLGSVEDYVSNRGQLAVQRALEGLDDNALAEVAREEMPELSGVLGDSKGLEPEKVQLVRQAVIDAQVDSLSLVDQLISERMKGSGSKDWEDSKVRARIAKKALSLNPKKALTRFLDWAKTSKEDDTALFRNASNTPPGVAIRMERLLAVHQHLKAEYGESESHYDQIIALFLKTKDPRYLRADPDPNKKIEKEARFSVDTLAVIMAGSSESCNWTSILTDRGPNMTISKEATQAFEDLSGMLDKVASHITTNHELMDIPKEAAVNFAKQCDALSDHADKALGVLAERKTAAVTGTGQGKSVGSDGNMTLDKDGFDASSLGELKSGPVRSEPDEPYMKINFLQKEFHELRNFQQSGMLDNVKEASAILRHFSDRFVLQAAALEAQAKQAAEDKSDNSDA